MQPAKDRDRYIGEEGFSLIEVMLAMIILAFAILGVMGMFQWSDQGLQQGGGATRALSMAQSRLEAKRAAPWENLLMDDMNGDGVLESQMRDDGEGADGEAGDGVYTADWQEGGLQLVWTVQPDRSGPLSSVGSAVIQSRALYPAGRGQWREVRLGTVRANPLYVGMR